MHKENPGMTTTTPTLELTLEAQASQPNYRYDILQPLLQGRVAIEGISLKTTGPSDSAPFYQDERFKRGDFDLLDINWGDAIPAVDAGWEVVCLPVFIKRKPVYNFLWVRAGHGIDIPKDLEGKRIATGGYNSAITIFTRGFLQHFYGVDLATLRWLLPAPTPLPLHANNVQTEIASGPRKAPVQRLMDGEVDASTGDITDAKLWAALESSAEVKRMFPDYQERNRRLWQEQHIFTPVHTIFMSRKLDRANPGLARKLFDAFSRSGELALTDALGDGTSYSLVINMREILRDQLSDWGNVFQQGISANKATIDTFLDYCAEQGVTGRRLSYEQFFASGTFDT
jgi:4,5-dihydroxyphthalate decarboxylase